MTPEGKKRVRSPPDRVNFDGLNNYPAPFFSYTLVIVPV